MIMKMSNDKIFSLKDQQREMLLKALEFFVDYKFNSGDWTSKEYAKRINKDISQNDYAKLCKEMGGKARFEPTL